MGIQCTSKDRDIDKIEPPPGPPTMKEVKNSWNRGSEDRPIELHVEGNHLVSYHFWHRFASDKNIPLENRWDR